MPTPRPELLVVGAASRDIDVIDARGWRLGGTVSYASLAAARLGVRVRALIGADDLAATAEELDVLREAGIEIELAHLARGPIFDNREIDGVRQQVAHEVSDALPANELPASWRDSPAVLLGPVAAEIGDEWLRALPENAFVALAWQGLIRDLVPGSAVRIRPLGATPLVRRADVLFVSAEDVVAGGPPLDDLLRDGHEVFVTHGDRGALHIRFVGTRRVARFVPPLPRRNPVDTTGAGDVFVAAYVAARLRAPHLVGTDQEWRLSAIAAAAASLNVAATSLAHVPTLRELCDALTTPRA